ncbi:MAG: ankyrin repeat domain-containing protein [Proteobacteria bacterium]|nr:ankyrin repeat domain-containing protein [Pseudomonadota bacterium]
MPTSTADRNEVKRILCNGSVDDLESLGARIADFPKGVDPWLGHPWICNAVDAGSALAVRWMISKGVNVNLRFETDGGFTVLHAAIEHGHRNRIDILRSLIAAGADINVRGVNDWTPLHMAAYRNDIEAVRVLLEAGADRSIPTRIDDRATAEEKAASSAIAKLIKTWPTR